jgi:hypothetical protein
MAHVTWGDETGIKWGPMCSEWRVWRLCAPLYVPSLLVADAGLIG